MFPIRPHSTLSCLGALGMVSFNELVALGLSYFSVKDLARGTNRTLTSQERKYLKFVVIYDKTATMFKPSEEIMIAYAVYLSFSIGAGSIRKYIGALSHLFRDNLQLCGGLTFKERTEKYHTFARVLKGISKVFGLGRQIVQDAFPPELFMLLVFDALDEGTPDGFRFAACISLATVAVRRLGDMMPFDGLEWDPAKHLTWKDLYFTPLFMVLRIKFTKTRQMLDEPLDFPIARQEREDMVCAVRSIETLQQLMFDQDPKLIGSEMPVFQTIVKGKFTGRPWTKDAASAQIRSRCTVLLKTSDHNFSGRSCRITGATMMMQLGISGELIGWLGDWRDTKHWRIYAHTPLPELLSLTQRSSKAVLDAVRDGSYKTFTNKVATNEDYNDGDYLDGN